MTETRTEVLLLPLMAYAACGLVLSLTVHLSALFGLRPGGNALFIGLHIGIFPLWIPVVLISRKMAGGTMARRKDYWRVVLADCPAWMRYMTKAFFVYPIVNFIIFFVTMFSIAPHAPDPPPAVWRGFSGHWMVFYSGGLAVLTSAYRRGLSNLERKCPNGHVVGYDDRFCATCGVPTDEQSPVERWR
jgi:hypothetical protein